MSKFDKKKIMPRYRFFTIIMVLISICVVGKAGYLMTAERDYWKQVADRVKKDSVPIKPTRGDILSCDGQLLASSLPEYILAVDFNAMQE